jgi:hypothetical protein
VKLVIAGLVAAGGAAFLVRDEIFRYVRIRRMGDNPALVGVSVSPQGNELALRRSATQRLWDRAALH